MGRTCKSSIRGKTAEALAAFMARLGSGAYPYWLRDVARDETSVLSLLIGDTGEPSALVVAHTAKLLAEVSDIPVARSPSILRKVIDCSRREFFDALLDVSLRSLIPAMLWGISMKQQPDPFKMILYRRHGLKELRGER